MRKTYSQLNSKYFFIKLNYMFMERGKTQQFACFGGNPIHPGPLPPLSSTP